MVIVDLETSNIEPTTGSILSIGAMDFENPSNTFYGECRVREGADINSQSLEIIGFTLDQITDLNKQSTTDILKKFLNWLSDISDQTIAGQNPHWDVEYLRHELKRSKIEDIRLGHRIVDLHTLAYTKMKELGQPIPFRNNRTDINLDTTLNFCGLKVRPGAHNALEDTKLEGECFSRLIFGKNLLPEYSDFSIPNYLQK